MKVSGHGNRSWKRPSQKMDESTPEADRKVVEDAVEDLTKEKGCS